MSEPVHIEPSRRVLFRDAVIPQNANLSGAVSLESYVLKGLILPVDWTLADVTFQAAKPVRAAQQPPDTGGSPPTPEFLDVYLDNNQVAQVTVSGSSRYIALSAYVGTANRGIAEALAGVELLKVRSGTPGTPVNQTGANKTVTLILGASTK